MNLLTKQLRVVALVALTAGLVAMGYGQGDSSLEGIWVPQGGGQAPRGFPDQLELLKDGTCIFEGNSASWKTSGERLFFMNIGGTKGLAYNYKVSNSALALINDYGQGAEYRKHRPGDKPLPTEEEQERARLMGMANNVMEQILERGHRYRKNGQYDKAIEDYTQIIKVYPDSPTGYANRGMTYSLKKDHDRAIADYTMTIKLVPNGDASLHNQRGYEYLAKDDYDNALADFNKAIQLTPNSANAYDSRGEAYLKKGDYDKSIADYSQALRLDPNFDSAKKGLAEAKKKKQGY